MSSYIEVFAGAGGMSVGLEKAGWKPLMLVDNDKTCVETLRLNQSRFGVAADIRCQDVTTLDLHEYKDRVDLLAGGGVPCQSFSQAGKRKGLDDARGDLFNDFIRLVDECEPKVFLIENVEGLLTHNNGATFQGILEKLNTTKSGQKEYVVSYKVLNANDYGVAQKRKRVFIVGIRRDLGMSPFQFPAPLPYKPVLRDALVDVPASSGARYPPAKAAVMRHVPPGGCWVNLPEDVKIAYMKNSINSGGGKRGIARRIAWDEPCLTLTTSPCQKQTERCHPDEDRPFTVREYARIQSFPDDYQFAGTTTNQYKQIGNAVACEVACHVGRALINAIRSPSPSA